MILAFAAENPDPKSMDRLLGHCELMAYADERPSARRRLEDLLGKEFARLLVFALTGDHALRRLGGRRRGASGP